MKNKILVMFLGLFLLITLTIYIGAENVSDNTSENETGVGNIEIENVEGIYLNIVDGSINEDDPLSLVDLNEEPLDNSPVIYQENNELIKLNETGKENQNETNFTIDDSYNEFNLSNLNVINPEGSSSNYNSVYISSTDIGAIAEDLENNLANEKNYSNEYVESYTCLIQNLGKKVIEIENCEEGDIEKIKQPEELENGEFEKEVIISSNEEFDKPIRVYSLLTTEASIEEIKIFWQNNNNLEITKEYVFFVEYYDENKNGLIDKVSWLVPHLSEQVFKIIVEVENPQESAEELLLNVTGPSGQTRNPINFNIEVNYSGEFSCNLKVGEKEYDDFSSNKIYNLNLTNGDYNWEVYCFNKSNTSIINATFGSFSINEGVYYTNLTEGGLYFLDLVENKIKYPEAIIINSTNPSNYTIKITKSGGQIIYTKEAFNTSSLMMNETLLNSAGNYALSVKFKEPSPEYEILKNFSVASANITLNTTSIKEGQSIKAIVNVNSPLEKITLLSIYYGDGGVDVYQVDASGNHVKEFVHKYTKKGTYSIKLIGYIGSTSFEIQKNGVTVTEASNPLDDDAPNIQLIQPEDEKIFYTHIVNFTYKANDNVKIQNCTFKLYDECASMNYCSSSDSNLVFPLNSQQKALANNYSVQNNKEVKIDLKDFEDGIYQWIVECYDNSSNYDWEIGFFEVKINNSSEISIQNYTKKSEIEELKEQADDFLTENFNLEEKEVLEDLNILNDTKYYKKRLLDIENFFKENYKYVSSQELREKKTEEYLEELELIKNRIPLSISINEKYEYVKNSIETDFEEIIQSYFDSTNTQISKSSLKKLVDVNRELQNQISVSTKVRDIGIEYNNGTQEIILVKKKIDLNDDAYTTLLEIIPKDIAESSEEVVFFIENRVIEEDPIFEIDYEDLENEEIIYYLTDRVKLKEIEKTDTILFEENLNKIEGGVTGFFVFEFVSGDNTIYLIAAFILLIALLILIPFVFKKFKIIGWKKEPNVIKVINLIKDIDRALKEKDIESARERYYKIKEIYLVLPPKTKPYFYEKIKEILIRIDRKDIFGLVKEYQEAKRKWNKEDVLRLYEDIKKIYERLPEKDRKKVYGIINGY